jgi:hypothetical protein
MKKIKSIILVHIYSSCDVHFIAEAYNACLESVNDQHLMLPYYPIDSKHFKSLNVYSIVDIIEH